MPEHEITIRYRVPLGAFQAEVHGHTLAEFIIKKLVSEFSGAADHYIGDGCDLLPEDDPKHLEHGLAAFASLMIPYVRVDKPSIVRNR